MSNGESQCQRCGLIIEERHYVLVGAQTKLHYECLKCELCSSSLSTSKTCFEKTGKLFCKTCYFKLWSSSTQCRRCKNTISHTDLVMQARGSYYHVNCFRCNVCSILLKKGQRFGISDQEIYCEYHYKNEKMRIDRLNDDKNNIGDPAFSFTTEALISPQKEVICRKNDDINTPVSLNNMGKGIANRCSSLLPAKDSQKHEKQHQQQTSESNQPSSYVTLEGHNFGDLDSSYPPNLIKLFMESIDDRNIDKPPSIPSSSPHTSNLQLESRSKASSEICEDSFDDKETFNLPLDNIRKIPNVQDKFFDDEPARISLSPASPKKPKLTRTLSSSTSSGDDEASTQAVSSVDKKSRSKDNKPKRIRTSFKAHQLLAMKELFDVDKNPDSSKLAKLAQQIDLPKRVLQVWFQNARAKHRKGLSIFSDNMEKLLQSPDGSKTIDEKKK